MNINLSNKKGALYAYSNAKSLLDAGELLAEAGKYGHATSLTILSCEESIKSIIFWSEYFGIDPDFVLLGAGNLHSQRLGTGRMYNVILHLTQKGMLDMLDYNSLSLDGMVATIEKLLDSRNDITVVSLKNWWNSANKLKQQGFYVDILNDTSISSPSEITEEQYICAVENAYQILLFARFVKVFSTSSKFECDRNMCVGYLKSLISLIESNTDEFHRQITNMLERKGLLEAE